MSNARWQVIAELFERVRELPPPLREQHLRDADIDPDVRIEVQDLLHFHDQPSQGVTKPDLASDLSSVGAPAAGGLPTGTRFAQFTLNRCVGRGASGVVYEATQDEPSRLVALKLLPFTASRPESLRRFRDEVSALARLQHPAIAQIYESGSQADGAMNAAFVAMEVVPNAQPITTACAQLPLRERISIFTRVCDAVHHAHLRGVIHRDLKPANILIDAQALQQKFSRHEANATNPLSRSRDADVEPKVIDFGVARLLDVVVHSTESTLPGAVIGTLQYMSPEQARGDGESLDVRTDIYSLGVVLYRLVAAVAPYEVPASPTEAATIIANTHPLPPTSHATAGPRNTDLDTIVLTAMAKDRVARYQSASALAEDLRRWLNQRPIAARPPTLRKRLTLWMRRNPAISVLASVLFVMVGLGSIILTRSMLEASRQRAAAASVSAFLSAMLSSPSVSERGREVRVVEVLEQAEQSLDSLKSQPLAYESACRSIAASYAALAEYGRALALHEARHASLVARLGANDPATLDAATDVADLCFDTRDLPRAEALLWQILEARTRQDGPDSLGVAKACNDLGIIMIDTDRSEQAEEMFRRSLAIRRSHNAIDRDYAHSLVNLGVLRRRAGDSEEAAKLFQEAIVIHRQAGTPAHLDLAGARRFYALALMDLGHLDQARAIIDELLPTIRASLGETHLETAALYVALARIQQRSGDIAAADANFSIAIDIYTTALGSDHRHTATVLAERSLLREQSQPAPAPTR